MPDLGGIINFDPPLLLLQTNMQCLESEGDVDKVSGHHSQSYVFLCNALQGTNTCCSSVNIDYWLSYNMASEKIGEQRKDITGLTA